MSIPELLEELEKCLCNEFVPADKRIDYQQVVADEKTGKRDWKTLMRAHQDCPHHGVIVKVIE
jgi:hypothetical protein